MLSSPQEKWPTTPSRVIVCCLLNALSNLLPLIIRVNRNAYLKLVLFLLGKHSPGVKIDPLICSRASSNWKSAFVWTSRIRVKNTMEKIFLKLEYFTINSLVKFLQFGSLNSDCYNKLSGLASLDMLEQLLFLLSKTPVYFSVYSNTCIQQVCNSFLRLHCWKSRRLKTPTLTLFFGVFVYTKIILLMD